MKAPIIEFARYGSNRRPEWQILTRIVCMGEKKYIWKTAMTDTAIPHVSTILENHEILARIYGREHVPACHRIDEKTVEIEYVRGISLEERLRQDIVAGDEVAFQARIRWYEQEILGRLSSGEKETSASLEFGDFRNPARKMDFGATFDNILCDEDGTWNIIGCEWLCCGFPIDVFFWWAIRKFQSGIAGVPKERMTGYLQHACRGEILQDTPKRLGIERDFHTIVFADPLAKVKKRVEDPLQRARQELAEQSRRADDCAQELAAVRATRGYRLLERLRIWRDCLHH